MRGEKDLHDTWLPKALDRGRHTEREKGRRDIDTKRDGEVSLRAGGGFSPSTHEGNGGYYGA